MSGLCAGDLNLGPAIGQAAFQIGDQPGPAGIQRVHLRQIQHHGTARWFDRTKPAFDKLKRLRQQFAGNPYANTGCIAVQGYRGPYHGLM